MNADEKTLGQLIHMIGRMQTVRADQRMEYIGLRRGQARLLLMLSNHDGVTHTEIADKLDVSPAAATKAIKRMEALGYLQRRPDPGDERVSRVYLLEGGQALIHQIQKIFREVDQLLLRDLSAEDQTMLSQPLEKMYHNLLNAAFEQTNIR